MIPCKTQGEILCPLAPTVAVREIDLLDLLLQLWRFRLWLIASAVIFSVIGTSIGVLLPVNAVSEARVIPAQFSELQAEEPLRELLASEQIDVPLDNSTWFTDFIKHWDSPVLQQAWLVKAGVKEPERIQFSRVSTPDAPKGEQPLYLYELLRVSAPEPKLAQHLLEGYMAYVSAAVNRDISSMVRQTERQQLASRVMKNGGVGPLLETLNVKPYALQAAPSLPALSRRGTILGAVFGALLGIFTATVFILMKDALQDKLRAEAQ